MPYLYAKAVEAHEEGTPMMRPMVFEFTSDPAVSYLDSQYMMGEALLAAPILREDSVCQYYLPKGVWTHLLSGEVRRGGCWQEDTYDYFSLPLYVKENTLLAVGREDHLPDYDYENKMDLRLYQLQDGAEAVCKVPDTNGNIVNVIRAVRNGNKIEVTSEKPMPMMTLTLYMGTEKSEHIIERGEQHVCAEIR